tara:strand:+ start:53 stop:445 length:393 start_codon:yes stop_codon:yes gene_type:complete
MDKSKIREHSFEDEKINIGIDFDGVIHRSSKGFYDGTIYDEPVKGSYEALKKISEKYKIIIFTAKAKPDRPLIGGKNGVELVSDWLRKHNMLQFVSDITSEKPRAVAYIDDKAIKFINWEKTVEEINEIR